MTNEEAIKRLKSDIYEYSDFTENPNENEFWTAFDMAIEALKERTRTHACDSSEHETHEESTAEPYGDCISRKAATDRFDLVQSDDKCMSYDDIMAFLFSLPPVEPERKRGRWEYVQYDGNPKIGNWHCSNCRLIVNFGFEGAPYYNYCPGCGADMRGDGW